MTWHARISGYPNEFCIWNLNLPRKYYFWKLPNLKLIFCAKIRQNCTYIFKWWFLFLKKIWTPEIRILNILRNNSSNCMELKVLLLHDFLANFVRFIQDEFSKKKKTNLKNCSGFTLMIFKDYLWWCFLDHESDWILPGVFSMLDRKCTSDFFHLTICLQWPINHLRKLVFGWQLSLTILKWV